MLFGDHYARAATGISRALPWVKVRNLGEELLYACEWSRERRERRPTPLAKDKSSQWEWASVPAETHQKTDMSQCLLGCTRNWEREAEA